MAITLMPAPIQQFLGADGKPLAGAKLYTYQPGTLIPKQTFTDSSGEVANPNPIIADSAGRVQVWLDGSYYMQLYDFNNVLQWSVDNVISGDQIAYASLQQQIDEIDEDLENYAPLTSPALLGAPTAPNPLTANNSNQVATTKFVHEVVDQGITGVTFIGLIGWFATPAVPTGWLACDGAAYNRVTYANLFSVIGTTFGIGDGVNTFNVPNLKNKTMVGYDSTKTFGLVQKGSMVDNSDTNTFIQFANNSGYNVMNGPENMILQPCIKA